MEPRSRTVVWAPSAYSDLDHVLAHRNDPEVLLDEVLDAAESLSTLGERGRIVPELDDPVTREILVREFRLIYEISTEHVHIVGFVSGFRDFETWRREREDR